MYRGEDLVAGCVYEAYDSKGKRVTIRYESRDAGDFICRSMGTNRKVVISDVRQFIREASDPKLLAKKPYASRPRDHGRKR